MEAKIKDFILEFIKNEFVSQKANIDFNISDNEYKKIINKTNGYFHSYFPFYPSERNRSIELLKKDEIALLIYPKKILNLNPRTLFQIKQYRNPTIGDGKKNLVTTNELWACFVSSVEGTELTGRQLGYDTIFYVAHTNEGFKIIDYILYSKKHNVWDNPLDESENYQISKVIQPGTLVETEKYIEPEDPYCLADFNKN